MTTLTFNGAGQPLSVTDPLSHSIRTDPLGKATTPLQRWRGLGSEAPAGGLHSHP
jgi:hypothetical protein